MSLRDICNAGVTFPFLLRHDFGFRTPVEQRRMKVAELLHLFRIRPVPDHALLRIHDVMHRNALELRNEILLHCIEIFAIGKSRKQRLKLCRVCVSIGIRTGIHVRSLINTC